MTFKVGDKVYIKKDGGNVCGTYSYLKNAKYIIITDANCSYNYDIYDEYGIKLGGCVGCFHESFIHLWADRVVTNNNKTIMQKVSIMMKKLLDSDTQTLVKAGYINGDLDLTPEGVVALQATLFDANKTALVALAQAELDEKEATN